jgi:hypothetical protein
MYTLCSCVLRDYAATVNKGKRKGPGRPRPNGSLYAVLLEAVDALLLLLVHALSELLDDLGTEGR